MARYKIRERIIFDIVDTEIGEAVTSLLDLDSAEQVQKDMERNPIASAPAPTAPLDNSDVDITFERRPDDVRIDVGQSSVT